MLPLKNKFIGDYWLIISCDELILSPTDSILCLLFERIVGEHTLFLAWRFGCQLAID